MNISE